MPVGNQRVIDKHFLELSNVLQSSLPVLRQPINQAAKLIIAALARGNKLIICGNGGSAADAQHIAAELVGRYLKERRPLAAIALTTDTSALTAISNDYDFEDVFARQIRALAKPGDVLLCISTSGNSANVVTAAKLAKKLKVKVISLTGNRGGRLKSVCDTNLIVPSNSTPAIQEVHQVIYHVICDLVESKLAKKV